MNSVILCGRLTRDPDVRYTAGENSIAVARYTLAVDRKKNKGEEQKQQADFINCIAFGGSGRFAEYYLHKGMKIIVRGKIQTGSYTAKDGHKVYTTDIVVEEHEFCESKAAGQDEATQREQQGNVKPDDSFMTIPDGFEESLPFN